MNSTIEQELQRSGHSFFQTVGDSMEPMLHDRCSTVVIKKVQGTLKKYDVALYRRPAGEYVLHRVRRVRPRDYIICGDNRIHRETVPKEWVIGVLEGYYPEAGSQYISCDSDPYRKYLRSLKSRYCVLWVKAFPGRAARKIRRVWNK